MPVLNAGRHSVKVVSSALGKSGTGTPHVAVLFEDAKGDRITWYGYLSDKAVEHTLKTLGVLGWDPHKNAGNIETLNGTDVLTGARAEIVVEMESYNGELNAKVKWVNEVGGGGLASMEATEAAAMAAEMRARIMSAPSPKVVDQPALKGEPMPEAAPVAAPSGNAPGADYDDDLPFSPLRLTQPIFG